MNTGGEVVLWSDTDAMNPAQGPAESQINSGEEHSTTLDATSDDIEREMALMHEDDSFEPSSEPRSERVKRVPARLTSHNIAPQDSANDVVGGVVIPAKNRRKSIPTSTAIQCSKCPSKFPGVASLNTHLRQHGRPGMKYHCPHCDYCSKRDDYMQNHIEDHEGQNGEVNSGKTTPTQSLASPKPSTSSAAPDSPSPPNVTEEAVARMTKGNPRITYMQMTATGQPLPLESSFKCWNCPFATTKHTSYVIHQQGHDANAKYGCKKCSYSAQTVQRLKNHDWVHSIQNSTTKKSPTQKRASSATANIEEAEDMETLEQPMTPPAEVENLEKEEGQEFISNIKITNVMGLDRKPTVVDASTQGILKLKGLTDEGKSSYILAVMLGLGYDLGLDSMNSTTTICGLALRNVINESQDSASIELTISLRAFPELQKEFGTQIKLTRRLSRTESDLSNVLTVSSADPRRKFKSVGSKVLEGKDLCEFLRNLKLSPERRMLLFMNAENVNYVQENPHSWFGLFESVVSRSQIAHSEIEKKIAETRLLLRRNQGAIIEYQRCVDFYKSQLVKSKRCPALTLNSDGIYQAMEEDRIQHNNYVTKLSELFNKRTTLQKNLKDLKKSNHGTPVPLRVMFNKYLRPLGLEGELIVSSQTKELCLSIWNLNSEKNPPTTLDEVKQIWNTLSTGKKRLAVIGLYFALWEISTDATLLVADAFTCTNADFHVPAPCLPLFWELINRKCVEQKTQCIISLPSDY